MTQTRTHRTLRAALGAALAAAAAAGCVDETAAITGTQSLRITLRSPADPGSVDARLPDSARNVTVDVETLDAQGALDTTFTGGVRVYAQFLGTITPDLDTLPLASIQVNAGVATDQAVTLPPSVLGPTTLWFDDGQGLGNDYTHGSLVGTSPTLWYRDPFVRDLQTPRDETAVDALSVTPLTDKQVSVEASRHGERGRLVVTSTYAQGYTVSDVLCADAAGTPPCTAGAYDHMLVFTFSAPRDQYGRPLVAGRLIERFTGGLTEFNGLTEVGFPRSYAPDADGVEPEVNTARIPAPAPFEIGWFGPLSSPTGVINFERNESALIAISNAYVCPLDDTYTTYKQWKIDPSGTGTACSGRNVINLITQGTSFTTDPATLVGQTLTRVVGIVRPVNIGSFNVWIVYPRGAEDVTP